MSYIINEAVSTLRKRSLGELIRKGVRFVLYRGRIWAYDRRGGYPVRVDGYSARFDVSSVWEVVALDYIAEEERDVLQYLLASVGRDDVFWDVGSHVGVHACLCGQKVRYVVAFEPYTPNADRLQRNMEKNGVNGTVVDAALSDEDATGSMTVPATQGPGHQWIALEPDGAPESADTVAVSVRRGDSIREEENIPAPNVVKVDVEGAAYEVFAGIEETLRRDDCHTVLVEVHLPTADGESRPAVEDFGHESEEIEALLESYGFTVERLLERESDYFLCGTKSPHPSE